MNTSIIEQAWRKIEITSAEELERLFKADNPIDFGIDTETDGIFHMTAKPFLVIFGWTPKENLTKKSTVVIFEPTKELLTKMYELCGTVNHGYMQNAKFDLHMIHNFGMPYPHRNILDTMTIARLVLEALPVDAGGDSLGLKQLADKYLEPQSSAEQKVIQSYKLQLSRLQLREWETTVMSLGQDKKTFSKPKMESLAADPVVELETVVPESIAKAWRDFEKRHPAAQGMKEVERVSYKDIYEFSPESKKAMKDYAYKDVIYTIALGRKFMPFVIASKQLEVLIREQKAMFALYLTERVGVNVDWNYIEECKVKMKTAIMELRKEIKEIIPEPYKQDPAEFASSPLQIKEWLWSLGYPKEISTAKDALIEMAGKETNEDVKAVLQKVVRHRALMKKYSTDLMTFETKSVNGRRYILTNQNNAVTGRLSNDMQQMPNEGITDEEGDELFNPRQAIIPSKKEGFSMIAYLDYSQVEVRLQAHYSWIAMKGKGDRNMLRMFVPFQCYATVNEQKVLWDPENPKHVNEKFIEENQWIQLENDQPWEITDFHLLTARAAFPEIAGLPKDNEQVQKLRKKAKGVNFAIQYGAGLKKIVDIVGNKTEAEKLYMGNKQAFQGLVAYGNMIKEFYNKHKYVENAYGRKYKLKQYTHKMMNYVIQGSGADMLKQKIAEVFDFLKPYKSRLVHNIHDELQFEIAKGEEHLVEKLKEIMEDVGNKFVVPIVSDIETTTTNWKEKVEGVCK